MVLILFLAVVLVAAVLTLALRLLPPRRPLLVAVDGECLLPLLGDGGVLGAGPRLPRLTRLLGGGGVAPRLPRLLNCGGVAPVFPHL